MKRNTILSIGILLSVSFIISSTSAQGYGNIEDDSEPSPQIQQQQDSLPQYDPSPQNGKLIGSPNNEGPEGGASQDYWWMNQNAFQKPPGHPGVETGGESNKPAPQQPQNNNVQRRPQNQQNNRSPNSYNPPNPSQNAFQQSPQPQRPNNPAQGQPFRQTPTQAPFKPQRQQQRPNNQFQQNPPPSFASPSSPNGFGWSAPDGSPQQEAPIGQGPAPEGGVDSGLNSPSNNQNALPPVAEECMLLNKADCHKGLPTPDVNNGNPLEDFQQSLPSNDPYDQQAYNSPPKPQQNYRPPPQSQPRPQPQAQPNPQSQPPSQQQTPASFYQPPPPQSQPPPPQPNQYESRPQNVPSNQNYQPQFSSDSQPASSFPIQNQNQNPRPSNNNFQQQPYKPQQQQQQYKATPRPFNNNNNNNQQFQNNAQGIRPPQNQNQQFQQQQQQYQPNPADQVQAPYPGCPAAMLCVPDDQCNILGIIDENARLSPADKAHRVAVSQCSEPSTGIEGVCCRDPNYKDPWPDMQGKNMNGNGNNNGGHHPANGNGHNGQSQDQSSGFGGNPNNNFQQQPSNNLRNSYAEFGQRRFVKEISVQKPIPKRDETSSSMISIKSRFQTCRRDEACVIHYKCQDGIIPTISRPTGNIKTYNSSFDNNSKKCKEDIFKNPFVCCKLTGRHTSTSPTTETNRPFTKTSVSTPLSFSPLLKTNRNIHTTTTYRPFSKSNHVTSVTFPIYSTTTKRPIIIANPNSGTTTEKQIIFSAPIITSTTSPIYRNNHLLTNTLSPMALLAMAAEAPTLISGVGLRFHSHLHTKIPASASTLLTTSTTTTTPKPQTQHKSSPLLATTTSPPTTTTQSSYNKLNETTMMSMNVSVNSTDINMGGNETLAVPPVREILWNFWARDNNDNSSTREKPDVNKIPKAVPLRKEFIEYPPFGFIFKGDEMFIPEVIIPAQYFRPPTYVYGERQYPIPDDFPKPTTTEMPNDDEETTTILPSMENLDLEHVESL